tara:strand:+ start:682 stop:1410 length:729 start_codon:yes stop_codon:yes gene_type:complete
MKNNFFCFFLFCLTSTQCFSQNQYNSLEGKKILVVYGGWAGHQPKYFANKISNWLKIQNANVILADSTSIYTNEKLMSELDLVVQHITMSKITDNQLNGLLKAVKNGTGLAGCHGGLGDSFRNNTEYQYMIGGQFVKHPGGQVNYTVNIKNRKDSITRGIKDFNIFSEQYYMHVDPALDILATTTFSEKYDPWIKGVIIPVVWKKKYGRGKIFYNSIGHSKQDYNIPEVWTLIKRGVVWATK